MLKLLGSIMIVGTCSIMGVSINRKLCDRIRILQEWISLIQEMKAEIVFRSSPISVIIDRFSRKQSSFTAPYFKCVFENLEVLGIQTAAEHAMEEMKKLPLTEDDLLELQHVFDAIGRYDALTQAEALTHSIKALEYQLADAKIQQGQKGKLYQAIGVSCGVALALIAV